MRILVTAILSLFVGLAMGFVIGRWAQNTPFDPSDDRLLGTWLSDGERTVAEVERTRKLDEATFARIAPLFGKQRITFTRTTKTMSMGGKDIPWEGPYRVLGKDRRSVVIHDGSAEVEFLDSDYTIFYFESSKCFWVTQPGGFREYFNRQ